jgi:hypothetical protein
LKVVGEHIELIGAKPAQGQGEATPAPTKPITQRPLTPKPATEGRDPELMEEPDDIPF